MEQERLYDDKLKTAFLRTIDARVPIINDEKLWEYYLDEYEKDLDYKTLWKKFKKMIKDSFNDDLKQYNDEVANALRLFSLIGEDIRKEKPIITKENYSDAINDFVHGFSTGENGKRYEDDVYYLTLDLKDAFYQCIDRFSLLKNKTFDEFIKENFPHPEIFDWRGIKIKICHAMDKKYGKAFLLKMELCLLSEIYDSDNSLIKQIKDLGLNIASVDGDSLAFKIGPENTLPKEFMKKYCNKEHVIDGIKIHVYVNKFNRIHYKINGEEHSVSFFTSAIDGKRRYRTKFCPYLWQLVKIYNKEELTEKDMFIREGSGYVLFRDKIEILNV